MNVPIGNRWGSLDVSADNSRKALELSKGIGLKLMDSKNLYMGISNASKQTPYFSWNSLDHSFLSMLFAALGNQFQQNEFFVQSHNHLAYAAQNNQVISGISLFGGLSQLGFAAMYVSEFQPKYFQLLRNIDDAVNREVTTLILRLKEEKGLLSFDSYDLISGLAGVAVYLITRESKGYEQYSLRSLVKFLVDVTRVDSKGNFLLKTPKEKVKGFLSNRLSTGEHLVNCGYAHGIPGVLAVLSLAKIEGLKIDGLEKTIGDLVAWLSANSLEDSWGFCWTDAFIERDGKLIPGNQAFDAWCYGSVGISRALWFAGEAIGCSKTKIKSISAMEAALNRLEDKDYFQSTSICHGLSGLLLISHRFYNDTKKTSFLNHSKKLFEALLSKEIDDSPFLFRDTDNRGLQVDDPSFLTGACGIALVLLSAVENFEPKWDRILLNS